MELMQQSNRQKHNILMGFMDAQEPVQKSQRSLMYHRQ